MNQIIKIYHNGNYNVALKLNKDADPDKVAEVVYHVAKACRAAIPANHKIAAQAIERKIREFTKANQIPREASFTPNTRSWLVMLDDYSVELYYTDVQYHTPVDAILYTPTVRSPARTDNSLDNRTTYVR